jgi:hypothetical protein
VETSLFLLGVIIAFISCKALCMFWILWRLEEYPLAVVGDAIASFMEKPDGNTKGACLGTAYTFNHNKFWQRTLESKDRHSNVFCHQPLGSLVLAMDLHP